MSPLPRLPVQAEQPSGRITDEPLHHGVTQRFRRVPRRQIAESSLPHLPPPSGRGSQVVARDGSQQEVFVVEMVFHRMLLVEDLKSSTPEVTG